MNPSPVVAAVVVVLAGPQTPTEWVAALNSEHQETRERARHALGSEGPFGAAAVAAMIDALTKTEGFVPLTDPNALDPYEIASLLADHGPAAVPAVVAAMKRPEPGVRAGAAITLSRFRPRSKEAAPTLIAALKDPVAEVRQHVASSLGGMRRAASTAVPALIAALGDPSTNVRTAAAGALGEFGQAAGPAVGSLVAALKDSVWDVRRMSAEALGEIGPSAASAVPALKAALRDWPADDPREPVVTALGGIGPAAKAVVPDLIELLRYDTNRRQAVFALGRIGPDAAPAVPDLLRLMETKDIGEREEIITALGRIGPPARADVPLLMAELVVRNPLAHPMTAANALGRIGPEAKPAVPVLTTLARDRSAYEGARRAAAEAVGKIDPAFAVREGLEYAALDIRLGKVPAVTLKPRPAVTEEQKARIRELIAKLPDVGRPGVGLSANMSGRAFAPLPDRKNIGTILLSPEARETPNALRELVALGPTALPFLLYALGDQTPTKLKVRAVETGLMFVGGSAVRHPFNLREKVFESYAEWDDEDYRNVDSYTVKVGDVCFVALGQIVGRDYQAVQYIPTAIVSVNSPASKAGFRDQLRAAWSGPESARVLLDSLLIDYAIEGVFNGHSLDGWSEGSDYQTEAAVRLLYYFPDETGPLIAARLRALDVAATDDWMRRDVRNRVRTTDFLKAVAWCPAPPVRAALADLAGRTTDPKIKKLLPGGAK